MMEQRSTKRIYIEIDGTPRPKPRMTQRDKWSVRKEVAAYLAYKDLVRWQVASIVKVPFERAVAISLHFHIPMPKSLTKKERAARLGFPHVMKPDLKNLVAGLEDALNDVAWKDDAQICQYKHMNKSWTEASEGRTVLIICPFYVEAVEAQALEKSRDRGLIHSLASADGR